MGTYTEAVQKLYVAYFSRPADAAGLTYWESVVEKQGGSTVAVSAAFAGSQEYKDTYAGMNEYQIVNAVYRNLFGRDAEPEGLAYWGQGLINKNFTIDSAVTTIAAGAQGTDATAYANKVKAATAFTAALDTTPEILGYAGVNANNAAKSWLAGITTDASLTAKIEAAALNASINAVITTAGGSSGKSFSLTDEADPFIGTAGNDNFLALVSGAEATLTLGDTLEGGAGVDKLTISSTVNDLDLSVASIANVEELSVSLTAAQKIDGSIEMNDVAFDTATFTRVRGVDQPAIATDKFTIDNANVGTSFKFVDLSDIAVEINYSDDSEAVSVSFDGATEDRTIAVNNNVTINGATDLTLNLTGGNSLGAVASVDSSTVTINVSDATATLRENVNFSGADSVTINAAKSLTVSTGKTFTVADEATITATGAGSITLGTLVGAKATVDASAMTGALSVIANSTTVSVTGGAGKDNITVDSTSTTVVAGDGDDYVNIKGHNYGGTSTSIKTVSGGAGFDTVQITSGTNLSEDLLDRVTGFERLAVAGGNGTYDLSVADFDAVVVNGDNAGAVTLSNVTGEAITFTSDVGTASTTIVLEDSDDFTFTIAGARGGSTTATLADDANDLDVGTLTVTDAETLTVVSNTDAGNVAGVTNEISSLTTNADELVITGTHVLTIGDFNNNDTIESIDASASSGLIMVDHLEGKGGLEAVTIIGSAKRDTILIGDKNSDATLTDGTGSAVNAGQGGDTITLTATGGIDNIIYQKGDSVVGYLDDGDGGFDIADDVLSFDVVTGFTTTVDKLDLSTFGFTSAKQGALGTGNGAAAADVIAFIAGEASNISKFYTNGGIQRAVTVISGDFTAIGGDATSSVVFIDSNGDGALSSGDEAILLVGANSVVLGDISF